LCCWVFLGDCDARCPGDPGRSCGGTLRISEFSFVCGSHPRFTCAGEVAWGGVHGCGLAVTARCVYKAPARARPLRLHLSLLPPDSTQGATVWGARAGRGHTRTAATRARCRRRRQPDRRRLGCRRRVQRRRCRRRVQRRPYLRRVRHRRCRRRVQRPLPCRHRP
jgi:hypothetical protein